MQLEWRQLLLLLACFFYFKNIYIYILYTFPSQDKRHLDRALGCYKEVLHKDPKNLYAANGIGMIWTTDAHTHTHMHTRLWQSWVSDSDQSQDVRWWIAVDELGGGNESCHLKWDVWLHFLSFAFTQIRRHLVKITPDFYTSKWCQPIFDCF